MNVRWRPPWTPTSPNPKPPSSTARRRATRTLTYRPHLDGLRVVAVYLVVLFHAGTTRLSGGYIGVDVFFVLSGYLVTQLLLHDLTATGSIGFGRFYARRVRRLLPAAFAALVVTAVVFVAIASPLEVNNAVGSFKAAFLYVTNWYFIHQATGYFGANLAANPVLQFWSLAIEEQFYLLWPLLLTALWWSTRRLEPRRRRRVVPVVVGAAAVASAAWALALRHADPNRAYYGTDARAYELMAGALLALTPAIFVRARRFRPAARVLSWIGLAALLLLATSWIHLDAIERGIVVTGVTVALLVGIETSSSLVTRVLANRTVVYLGRISYGTYLWHWIVIIVATRSFHTGTTTTVLVVVVATALASLSYELLEQPVRLSTVLDRHRRAVVVAGLTASVVAAAVVVPAIVDRGRASTAGVQGSTAGFTRVPRFDAEAIRRTAPPFTNCYRKPVQDCTVAQGTTGPHLLLIGDSHADMLIPTFTRIARDLDATLSVAVRGGCPWQRHLTTLDVHVPQGTFRAVDCASQQEDLYDRVIPQLAPDIIFAVDSAYEDPKQPLPFVAGGRVLSRTVPADMSRVITDSTNSLHRLRASGAKVVALEPIPVVGTDQLLCLTKATFVEECRQIAARDTGPARAGVPRARCPGPRHLVGRHRSTGLPVPPDLRPDRRRARRPSRRHAPERDVRRVDRAEARGIPPRRPRAAAEVTHARAGMVGGRSTIGR